jgi:hypothetical protein
MTTSCESFDATDGGAIDRAAPLFGVKEFHGTVNRIGIRRRGLKIWRSTFMRSRADG